MEILNLGGAPESNTPAPKSRKKLRVILGIGALAAVTGIGSTLAANISLNGGGNVEFGQGVATTAACDDDITITPVSTFSNTEEDATFAMTAIQVSDIDLTPEGWNLDASPPTWDEHFNYSTRTWDAGYEEHAGQYVNVNGDWTNTCENKVLMLRGYTDNTDYAGRTANDDISSPLLLNGWDYLRPSYGMNSYNSGVGFRIRHTDDSDPYYYYLDATLDCDYDCNPNPISYSINFDGDFYREYSSVTIYLDEDGYRPPADSRWVDKITAESGATFPNSWDYWLDF